MNKNILNKRLTNDQFCLKKPGHTDTAIYNNRFTNNPHLLLLFLDGWFFKGFHGKAQMAKDSYLELKDHQHLGHVDAAFRLHQPDHPEHDHMFVFLVWRMPGWPVFNVCLLVWVVGDGVAYGAGVSCPGPWETEGPELAPHFIV